MFDHHPVRRTHIPSQLSQKYPLTMVRPRRSRRSPRSHPAPPQVLVIDKKYAWYVSSISVPSTIHQKGLGRRSETCIKGHRSSACKHTDRPLFEIKKKGRPVTQCDHCRELRKTKQVHVKCLCGVQETSSNLVLEPSHSKKGRHSFVLWACPFGSLFFLLSFRCVGIFRGNQIAGYCCVSTRSP